MAFQVQNLSFLKRVNILLFKSHLLFNSSYYIWLRIVKNVYEHITQLWFSNLNNISFYSTTHTARHSRRKDIGTSTRTKQLSVALF